MSVFETFLKCILLTALLTTLHVSRADLSVKKEEANSNDNWEDEHMHPSFINETQIQPLSRREENYKEFWLTLGKKFVRQQKQQKQNTNVAKNIIIMMGDGMGLATMVAARNYIKDEKTKLSFEEFPYVGLSKTYSVNTIVSDSAVTGTAFLCGVMGNYGTIGVNGGISHLDCEGMKNTSNHVYSIAKWAMDAGKSAGFVTTSRVTHSSPSGVYGHAAARNWESDADIQKVCGANHSLDDTAKQLIHGEVGARLKVMMGGGKNCFIDRNFYPNGKRLDGRNLIEEFTKQSPKNVFIETKDQLNNLVFNQTERLLGIFNDGHLDYQLDSVGRANNTQPTLSEMTQTAIEFMQQKSKAGYFLFIEGAKIDLAHHDTKARLALEETKQFSEAVHLARQMTSEDDTLIVALADHSHVFTVAGYQDRGSNIFSLMEDGRDGLPYEPLSYANGESYNKFFDVQNNKRLNPAEVLTNDANDFFPATVPIFGTTHSGEDVGVFASGPWAHLFTGVYELNAVPHVMAYAACVGDGRKVCDVL